METEAVKRELDDSGCVQDASSPPLKKLCVYPNGYTRQVGLLDLSDDVLLIILRQCSPMELKALAFTCPRLARLSLERALWQRVDARAVPYDRRRLRWLLAYAVDKRTTELLLTGHAEQAASCEDFNKNAREKNAPRCGEEEESNTNGSTSGSDPDWNGGDVRRNPTAQGPAFIIRDMGSGISVGAHSCSHIASFRHNLQRPNISHAYSEDSEAQPENSCPSPVFTLCESILNRIKSACNLTYLALEYCNINCKMTGLNLFPSTLKQLSLKGSRCYNLPLDKTYLFKIQDYLPALEFLDVSHCDWLEPASLLPLSKLPALSRVFMRNCRRLTEFVAYASLAARYGFKALKEIDFQGSPVGDSEVSAFGWVQTLEVIRLSAPKQPKTRAHEHKELIADWEKEEPEYLTKFQADYQVEAPEDPNEDINIQKQSASLDEPCGLGIVVCLNDIRRQQEQERRQREERRRHAGQEQRSNNNRENEDVNRNENDNAEGNASPAPKRRKVNGCSQTDEELVENQPSCSRQADSNDNQNQPTATFRRISPPVMSSRSSQKKDDGKKQNEDEKNTAELKSSINEGAGTSNSEPSSSNCEPSTSNCEPSTSNCEPSTSNNGPSTSKSPQDPSNPTGQNPDAECNRQRFQQFVRFRQNERPVIIRRHVLENDQNENNNDPNQNENANQNQALPRHSVLYVSVAQQVPNFDFRNLYSCRDYNCIGYDFRTNNPISSTLITDSSISRFGRSDGENVNYVHLGENQLILRYRRDTGARPDRSNLREIVANNYRFITDRSLTHLATAAPNLRFVDFRGTRVTNNGVENFLSIRPDCEVLFDPFQEDNHDGGDSNE